MLIRLVLIYNALFHSGKTKKEKHPCFCYYYKNIRIFAL
nr:MAG TPA: hypothetical protein [Caudoviricetes sp.]